MSTQDIIEQSQIKQHQAKQSQIKQHQAAFWGEHTATTTHTPLTPISTLMHTQLPTMSVVYSLMGDCLQLSFFIEKKPWLDLSPLDSSPLATGSLQRADFLWQANCLECFVEFNHEQGYHEINVAPNGDYAIYQFDDYRTPDCMPPKHGDGSVFVVPAATNDDDATNNNTANNHNDAYWIYHWAVKFPHTKPISKIHPTVILYHNDTPIFYACAHANPPDFHDKAYWVTLPFH